MAMKIAPKQISWVAFSVALLVPFYASHAQAPSRGGLAFEVATIRPAKERRGGIKPADGGDGYVVDGSDVLGMISLMYKLPLDQIEGAPAWARDDPYDITAKTDARYSLDDLHAMFKDLLTQRFGLKFHWETKPGNAYVLTVDKSGSKMTVNDSPEDYQTTMKPGHLGMLALHRESMEHFTWMLGQMLRGDQRPVVDQTGLKGNYDFNLAYMPPGIGMEPGRELPPELRDLPPLFDALRDQLGLRLTAQKAPVHYMVIDHVERPEAN